MRILIMKFRNIGDVLLVSPIFENLKSYYHDLQIDIAVNKGTEDMVAKNPFIDNVIVYERDRIRSMPLLKKLKEELKFILSFRKSNYDIVINLTKGERGGFIAGFSGASVRMGYEGKGLFLKKIYTHHLPSTKGKHTVESNLNLLRLLKIPILHKKVKIYWDQDDEEVITKKLKNHEKFIHLHPVSRWRFKCISDHTMAKVVDFCELKLKTKVVITASPLSEEIDKIESILKICKSKPINFSGKLSLSETAALNKRARFFIGVDTAVMHISAANNTPVLAFFGPSGAHQWGPWDNNLLGSGYNNINGVQSMGIHTVISESRSCQPCGKDGCDGSKISDCLMNINFDLIEENINKYMTLHP